MTPEQFEKAKPIISRLDRVRDALEEHRSWLKSRGVDHITEAFDDDMSDVSAANMSQFSCCLSQYEDGSGWQIDMSGTYVAQEVMQAVVRILEDKERYYLAMLEEIE